MNDYDVVLLDERNAVVPPPMAGTGTRVPVRAPARPWPPQAPRPYPAYPAPAYGAPYPAPAYGAPYGRPMIVVQRAPSLWSQIDFGEIVEHGVTLLAAMQSLPDAPTVTGEVAKDVGNTILYQEALADHAKSDERVRAFGGLVAQVVKALANNARQQRGYGIGG